MTASLGLLYGLDNALVALALAPMLGWRRGLLLAVLFGLAEMLMPLVGAALAVAGETPLRAGLLALLATTIAGLLFVRRDPAALVGSPAALAALAVLLGLDNLAAGIGLSVGASLALGLSSAVLASAACLIGVAAAHRLDRRQSAMLSAAALLAVAGAGLLA